MRVLLISPLKELDPPGGDVTYTELLLEDPPEGVVYDTYDDALRKGTLIEHGRWSSAVRGPNAFSELFLWCFLRFVDWCRQRRLLFWEPFRFFSVSPGAYDIVHLHMFGVRFVSLDCPLVVSNSVSHHFLYRDARNFSEIKLKLTEGMEILLCVLTGLVHPSYRLKGADDAIAFTKFMSDWYIEKGLVPSSKVDIIPPYLPLSVAARGHTNPLKIGFVARDFEIKGGPAVLEAFELVRKVYPDCVLHIVGSKPQLSSAVAAERNIIWEEAVDRDTLLNEILPSITVFAYPTNFDGLPLILLHVMALGIPSVCSNYPPITEIVEHGVDGLICSTRERKELAENIVTLLNPAVNELYSANVLKHFNEQFSAPVVKPKLSMVYSRAISKVS
ncbi:MAG: glycosyltransferase [Candidatus Melainabacteria bacterium]|nr:MAG: glycosyltransferase [Candidatus Melainabacteria bacterium]